MITEETRSEIFEKTNGKCHYCGKILSFENRLRSGRAAWEVEHMRPRAKGGTDHLNNLVPACWECNISKGTSPARTHMFAVSAIKALRGSRRRWRIAGQALLPAAVVAGLTYLYLKKSGPTEEQLAQLPKDEQDRLWLKNLLIPVFAGLAVIVVILILKETSNNA